MKCANGLVDIMGKGNRNTINMNGENINDKFKMMDRIPAKTIGTNPCQTINNVEPSLVSRAFFSNENIEIIHRNIIKCVYECTGTVIDKQNTQQLLGIMREIFMENRADDFTTKFANNNPISDRDLILHLNSRVIQHSVRIIKSEVIAYNKYRQDISTLAVPQDLPILSNMRNKTLELKPWF